MESGGWILLSCISTVKRSQLSTAGEALMQLEIFEANRLLFVFASLRFQC
jgi:hypothetical protein